jgi:hypothetical protein
MNQPVVPSGMQQYINTASKTMLVDIHEKDWIFQTQVTFTVERASTTVLCALIGRRLHNVMTLNGVDGERVLVRRDFRIRNTKAKYL